MLVPMEAELCLHDILRWGSRTTVTPIYEKSLHKSDIHFYTTSPSLDPYRVIIQD